MDQAEQLRIIKANKQIRPTARVITVTSGKGGVGKSNMSINLAIQFRKMGKRVVILDADFGLANIEIMVQCQSITYVIWYTKEKVSVTS